MLKILHTADFHIGAGFTSFGEKLAINAENLQFLAISTMINYANVNEIDAILIAGDTFDNHVVDFQKRAKLFSILAKFEREIFIVCGNHDYYFKGSFWDHTEIPQNITLIKTNEWQTFEFEKYTLFGASFTNIYEKIEFSGINLSQNKINIGLVHADILTDSQYNPLSKTAIKNSKLDYIAVGHNHKFSEILKVSDTYFSAPGNISATGFDEMSAKGFIVAKFDENGSNYEFVSSKGLEILNHELDISFYASVLDIRYTLQKKAHQNIFLNLSLVGINNFQLDIDELENCLKEDFFAVNIEDSTDKPENLWRFIDEDNLLGEFTRIMRVRYDKGEKEVLTALKLGLDSLIF
ncbi:MAG: metallophosphoesterase [Clostridia bacterium]